MKTRNVMWVLTIIEVSILTIIGLFINQDPTNKDLISVFTTTSIIIVISRVISSVDNTTLIDEKFDELEAPIRNLAQSVDINTSSKINDIKTIANIYMMIANPQLRVIKDSILQRTIRELEELNYEQRTPVLDEPDFYKWLYTEFQNAKSTIHIVSMDEELEWTDTPEEQKFYRINVEAAQRGVELIRVFVFHPSRLETASNNKAIYGHRKGSTTKLIGKYVNKEKFARSAHGAIEDAAQGFIVIDERMVIIDVFSDDGQARGYITFNPIDIKKYEALFRKFETVAQDLEFEQDLPLKRANDSNS